MAATKATVEVEQELMELGRCFSDFALCATTMVALLRRIRQQTPETGLLRTAATQEERRLFNLGQKAIGYVGQSALTAFGQATPQLPTKRWMTPRLRKPDLSRGPTAARVSFLDITMDLVMALTEGDGTKLDSPRGLYTRTGGSDSDSLDGRENLLDLASEMFQLCSADVETTYSMAGFQVLLPAIEKDNNEFNTAAFPYVVRTLTALAHSHSVWFSCVEKHFQFRLWGQLVPGTDLVRVRPSTGPRGNGCRLSKAQPRSGRELALSKEQEQLSDDLQAAVKKLAGSGATSLANPATLSGQANVALQIVRNVARGRNSSDANVSWEYSALLLTRAALALEVLDREARAHFDIQLFQGTEVEVHHPETDRGPKPKWLDFIEYRRWTILNCLDHLFSKKGTDHTRTDTALEIIILCPGSQVGDPKHRDNPGRLWLQEVPAAARTQAWRMEMMGYVRLAIVGAAQYLSSQFDDADVMLASQTIPKARDREVWHRDRAGAYGA